MDKRVTLIAIFLPQPGQVPSAEDALRDVMAASRAEPGCMRYDLLRTRDMPVRFMLYEVYRDEEALADHRKTRHYREFRERIVPLLEKPNDVMLMESVAARQAA